MLKNPDDASSPSEESLEQTDSFITPDGSPPSASEPAGRAMHFLHNEETVLNTEDTEDMESVFHKTTAEPGRQQSTAENTANAAQHDKTKLTESADLFNCVLNTALQEYSKQYKRLLEYFELSETLRNDVDRLTNTLEETEQQRLVLMNQNSQTTAELDAKVKELFDAIELTNEQRQQLEAAARQEEVLCSTISDFEQRCHYLEMRAREADELEGKLAELNAELAFQGRKLNEIQTKAHALGNDNEILRLSLEEAEQFRQELEQRNKQTKTEYSRKVVALTEALRTKEEQHRELEAEKTRSEASFNYKIDELSATLQSAEHQHQQLETQHSESTAEFTSRIGELTVALQAAGEERDQLKLSHNRSSAEFTARIDELTAAWQGAEKRHQQLEAANARVTSGLTREIEELLPALRANLVTGDDASISSNAGSLPGPESSLSNRRTR